MLGEGEVSIVIGGGTDVRIQESVFTGLWRVIVCDAEGRIAGDWLEAAALPRIVVDIARREAQADIGDGAPGHGRDERAGADRGNPRAEAGAPGRRAPRM